MVCAHAGSNQGKKNHTTIHRPVYAGSTSSCNAEAAGFVESLAQAAAFASLFLMVNIVHRSYDETVAAALAADGISPVLARILAARGIKHASQLECSLKGLIPPERSEERRVGKGCDSTCRSWW